MKFIKTNYKLYKQVINRVFPEYKGRRVTLVVHDVCTLTGTYWSGGSRSYYAGVNLETGDIGHLKGTNAAPWNSQVEGLQIPLTESLAVLEHRYSGTWQAIWIHVHPSLYTKLEPIALPESA
jgi:hypothetical protein